MNRGRNRDTITFALFLLNTRQNRLRAVIVSLSIYIHHISIIEYECSIYEYSKFFRDKKINGTLTKRDTSGRDLFRATDIVVSVKAKVVTSSVFDFFRCAIRYVMESALHGGAI